MKADGWLATVSDLSKSDIFSAAIEVVGVTRRGQGARAGGGGGGGTVTACSRAAFFGGGRSRAGRQGVSLKSITVLKIT